MQCSRGSDNHRGAKSVSACATHGVLSGPAIERIQNSYLDELVLLDTIALPQYKQIGQIRVLTCADFFANAIDMIFTDRPVSVLFS